MKSPFPGVDPYLEQHWAKLHNTVLINLREAVQTELPEGVSASIELSGSYPPFISIKQRDPSRIGTIVEVLDHALKSEKHLIARRQRVQTLIDQGVHFVEIDLLRSGSRTVVPGVEDSDRTAYQVCVYRSGKPSRVEVFLIPLYVRLPVITIPSHASPWGEITVDLQKVLDECYPRDDPSMVIDYSMEPLPPLDPEDWSWADELLRGKGIRY
jgi:hypothetical protein